ncbi:hypothetical protein [Sphingobium estronivorans]|uniref:hypothetical protein n=1 Tax=Sphingobium estronivorans TaxID=1577690 RepID=UPI001238AF79|nr:hypothetical protein [Sphingobium estronivorans]
MSARFWLFSSACAGAALIGGYGLGLYVTTPPRAALETPLPQAAVAQGAPDDSASLAGPAVIDCKGCGPTLADRQMAADRAGWDGMSDPVVRDYAEQDEAIPVDEGESPPPVTARTLPAAVERFAADESEDRREPVRIAQVQNSKTPAEEAPADAAWSY